MDFTEIIGIAAGTCTSSSLIPQVVTTVKKKTATEVSTFMFIVLLAGNGLWMYYGIEKKDVPIIATNALSLALNVVMLFLKYKYAKD